MRRSVSRLANGWSRTTTVKRCWEVGEADTIGKVRLSDEAAALAEELVNSGSEALGDLTGGCLAGVQRQDVLVGEGENLVPFGGLGTKADAAFAGHLRKDGVDAIGGHGGGAEAEVAG